ncbi:MAG: ankyrin repeat domain-containing protein [Myxococcales bacterium]|nr:ankyrin repeat domain-containing protein [Myxococcales bacterium]USN51653.1 MAG: ankyrin repeat domain-containing protein [Myxococcales bacterium]
MRLFYKLIYCLFVFMLSSTAALSMEDQKVEVELSNFLAKKDNFSNANPKNLGDEQKNEIIDHLSSVQNGDGQEILQSFLNKLETSYYFNELVKILRARKERAEETPALVFNNLVNILLRPKQISEDVFISFLDDESVFQRDDSQFGYHGSRAIMDILRSGQLKAETARCKRFGIFFGRSCNVARDYFTDHSSNIHKTWNGDIVRGILVLRKDGKACFEYSNASFGSVEEYIVRQDSYDLKNLEAILFASQIDAEKFAKSLQEAPNELGRYRNVPLFVLDYKPLEEPQIKDDFISTVKSNWLTLMSDGVFAAHLAEKFPSTFFRDQNAAKTLLQGFAQLPEKSRFALLCAAAKSLKGNDVIYSLFSLVESEDLLRLPNKCIDSAFCTAILAKNLNGIKAVLASIGNDEELKKEAAKTVGNYNIKKLFRNADGAKESLDELTKAFSSFPKAMRTIAYGYLYLGENDSFAQAFEIAIPAFEKENGACETLLVEAAKRKNFVVMDMVAKRFPVWLLFESSEINETALYVLAADSKQFDRFSNYVDLLDSELETIEDEYGDLPDSALKIIKDKYGDVTIAHEAAKHNNTPLIKMIAERAQSLFFMQDHDKSTPLNKAASNSCSLEVVKLIMEHAPNSIQLCNRWQRTPVTTAANHNNAGALRVFCEQAPKTVEKEWEKIMKQINIHNYEECRKVLQEFFPERF